MGDKSPKSRQKNASQKQTKEDEIKRQKQKVITDQQATKLNLAAKKKK